MMKATIISYFQRTPITLFLLFIFLCGCATKAEFYGKSYTKIELWPPYGSVISHDMILKGETEDDIVKKILATLPSNWAGIYLTRCYMHGIEGIVYAEFLRKFGAPGAPFYPFRFSAPLSTEAEEALIRIFVPLWKNLLDLPEGLAREAAKQECMPGRTLERLMDRNTVMALNQAERTRRYISTLSDREWDLIQLQMQGKQIEKLSKEIRSKIAAQTEEQSKTAREIKSSIEEMNRALRLQPAFMIYEFR